MRKIISVIICVVIIWTLITAVDFILVRNYRKPLFCIGIDLADDGGSGKYIGLGYSFYLEGGFRPDDNEPDVTSGRGYLFGREVMRVFWENMIG